MKQMMTVALMMAMLGLVACDNGSSGGSAGSSTTTSASGGGSGGGGSIGVKECDDYVAKWQACYKDPAMKSAAQPAFDQMKQAWAEAAKTPAGKSGLATACKQMVDNFPSAACK
jgi:hypothetical protein